MTDKTYKSKLDSSTIFLVMLMAFFAAIGMALLLIFKYHLGWNIDTNTIVTIAIGAIMLILAYYCFNRFRYSSINGLYLNTYISLVPIDSIPIGSIDKISNRKAARLKHGQHHFNQSSPPGYLSIQGRFPEQEIIVSIEDKQAFIDHLLAINPNIVIDI
ncbi:MAG TPA: hypothetical protein VGF79_11075 [Bacteroidia bacterium]